MRGRIAAAIAVLPLLSTLAACGGTPAAAPPPTPAVVADGCDAIRAEIAASNAPVDQPATPLAMKPAPVRRPVPRQVLAASRTPTLEVTVVVDTLGKPQMKTFTVVKSSHRWYADGARAAIAKWTFRPAMHRGCKIERPYRFGFTGQ